jgi:hypothetical protein
MHLALAWVWWIDWELTKKMDSMDMSKILFLFQSAYVLRMKKTRWIRMETHDTGNEVHSEKTTDTIPIPVRVKWQPSARKLIHECTMHVPESISSNTWHLWQSHALSHWCSLTLQSITYTWVVIRVKAYCRTSVNSLSGRRVLKRNARYRFEVRRTKGRYRVTIYRPFTLLHCDLSKNDHFTKHIKTERYHGTGALPLHRVNSHNHRSG